MSAGAQIEHVVVGEGEYRSPSARMAKILGEAERLYGPAVCVPDAVVERLGAGRSLGAVHALVRMPVGGGRELCAWLDSAVSGGRRLRLLVLEEIMDPGNVGALMRTAHALGAGALVAIGGTDPFHPRAARTSMGSVFRLPVFRVPSRAEACAHLRSRGVRMVGAATEAAVELHAADFGAQQVALFVGNEGQGLSAETRHELDCLVKIPMSEAVDSLSVNAATAVILYAMTPRGLVHGS
jgi:TrmH family RNA methyltransferase